MRVLWYNLTKDEKLHLISQPSLVELYQELHRRAVEDEGEGVEEVGKEEFKLQGVEEFFYAFRLLASRYPHEEALLMVWGSGQIPQWLQKEILERRERKDV